MEASSYPQVKAGDGYSVGHLDDLGEGYGFRKVRKGLGVEAFGVNAIVMPPGYATGFHYHEEQDELYFVHRGTMEIEFGDGSVHQLPEGTFAHVDAHTLRRLRNVGESDDAIYVCVGGKGGYIGRDGRAPEGENAHGDGPPGAVGAG
ncbi:MAG TPA: cupin domain-containing protein [Solirubrobacteraceae bacterium]|jgi:mannose-6-phosphate isomerase-like protein (cupin superfamily)